jgi:ketosteroid isomerase-like protein
VGERADLNREVVGRFWEALYARDWDALRGFFAPEAEYTDVPTPDDDVAVGPDQIVARLRLGLEPLEAIVHHPRHTVAEGDLVYTEHEEEWRWPSGEQVTIKFVSAQELRDGLIVRWWDYPDLQKLLGAAPQWWIEHIMQGYR